MEHVARPPNELSRSDFGTVLAAPKPRMPRTSRRASPARPSVQAHAPPTESSEPSSDGRQAPTDGESHGTSSAIGNSVVTDNQGTSSGQDSPAIPSESSQPGDAPPWTKIAEAIRRQVVYPMLARRRGMQGRTTIGFFVDSSGTARDVRVVESSGYAILDAAALDAVARATPMPAATAPTQVVMPIVFALH